MSGFFVHLFNLSVSSAWLIAAVILLRLFIKKVAPRWTVCLLWAIVGLRLIIPFSIESEISLLPSAQTIDPDALYYSEILPDTEYIQSGLHTVDDRLNDVISSSSEKTENPLIAFAEAGSVIWIVGAAGMLLYAIINYLILKRRISESLPDGAVIRRSENVGSPFILGVIKPKIYLPFGISPETEAHIIAHEMAHLKRRDHLIKPFGYILFTVYWFNPLVWIAYILLCRDIEIACDEKVVSKMSEDARKAYAGSLLQCGIKRSSIAACPVAFGEVGVKERIKNALTYKKPLFWVIIVAVIISIALSVFFFTAPPTDEASIESNVESVESDEADDSSEISEESEVIESEDISDYSEPISDESIDSNDKTNIPIKYEGSILAYTYSGEADRYIEIPEKESEKICDILNNEVWTESSSESAGTHVITVGNDILVYDKASGSVIDRKNERTLSLTDDENTTIASTLEEEEKILKAMQKTHQTPEGLNVKSDRLKYHGGNLSPTYIQLSDVDLMFRRSGDRGLVSYGATTDSVIKKGIIKQAGLKIWICTESGRKIDYVYSNSDGIFRFECPEGSYKFLLDSDGYVDKYVLSKTYNDVCYTDIYAIDHPDFALSFTLSYLNRNEDYIENSIVYREGYEDFKVRVIDSETKEPLKNVAVTVSKQTVYTNDEGMAVFDPLLAYINSYGSAFSVDYSLDGYITDGILKTAALYQTYMELELEPIHEYDFSITVLDRYTGEPVSGVEISYDLNTIYADAQLENTITGKDGTIKGKITSDEFRYDIIIKYTKTYTLPDCNTYVETEYCEISLDKNNLNVTVELILHTYSHSLSQQ